MLIKKKSIFYLFLLLFCFCYNVHSRSTTVEYVDEDSVGFTYAELNLDFCLKKQVIRGSSLLHLDFNHFLEFSDTSSTPAPFLVISLSSNFSIDSVFVTAKNIIREKKNVKREVFDRRRIHDYFRVEDNRLIIPIDLIRYHFRTVSSFLEQTECILEVFYHGSPQSAKNPPWEGGFIWSHVLKDAAPIDTSSWVGVACQNEGASVWWPIPHATAWNYDSLGTDICFTSEPDSMRMIFSVDKPYSIISNGILDSIIQTDSKQIFHWFVSSPINTYNVTVNIAEYAEFDDTLVGLSGLLDLDYYVLPQNLEVAKKHFKQVKPMLHIFENKFGPYPFYEDGYKLVETSYVGMEHQSCISYGNQYKKGYLGRFPENMDFDFIIIHETAHEWWGNSLSMAECREMWIHESFATYAEALYVEDIYGYNSMLIYLMGQKKRINNKSSMFAYDTYLDTDVYYKGSWMLHTLRTVIDDDVVWNNILKGLQSDFKHATVTTEEIIRYMQNSTEHDLYPFFTQYLFNSELPIFKYYFTRKGEKYFLHFKWDAVKDFNMPLLATINGDDYDWIYPNDKWQNVELKNTNPYNFILAEELFLFDLKKIK